MRQGFSHHDTTNEQWETLDYLEVKAVKLETIILVFFKQHPNKLFTPIAVWKALNEKYLIGSVRRAITNLTPKYLTKTEEKIKEVYGSSNYQWIYIKKPEQTRLF